MMSSRRLHVLLTVSVAVWYLASTYLPQAAGSCLGTTCEPTPVRLVVSVLIPLAMAAVPVALERFVFGHTWSGALDALGVTRWHRGGFPAALLYLIPLFAFFPVYAAVTGQTLALQANWLGLVAGTILNNGINEETMMRGFVFRRLREGRTFWRAAALSTGYFAAYHVPLIISAGALIGTIGVIIAIPTGLLTAYVYERGNRTVWASALVHAGTNAPVFLFTVGTAPQPLASSLYMCTSIAVATAIVVVAARRLSTQT
jgi:membrane protease YdiL (CAAX protease family)